MEPLREIAELSPQQKLRIYCLGSFRVIRPGENFALGTISKHKMWLLLKYLIVNKRALVSTDAIMDLLWPEQKKQGKNGALRTTLSRLKSLVEPVNPISQRAVGSGLIKYKNETCSLNFNYPFWLDVDVFEKLCGLAHRQGIYDRQQAIVTYLDALELYQGDFLADDPDLDWAMAPREYYKQIYLDLILELTQWLVEEGDLGRSRRYLENALEYAPYNETMVCRLIEVLYRSGNLQEARRKYTFYSTLFYTELGVHPSPEMKRLYEMIKVNEACSDYADIILEGNLNHIDQGNGPFICNPDLFMTLIMLEYRRSSRGGQTCLVVIEDKSPKGEKETIDCQPIKRLEEIVSQILQRSDMVCPLDDTHLALLLPSTDMYGGKTVISNLVKKYSEVYGQQNQFFRYRLQQISSF